ncbi:MAG: TRAP transporter large permease subunit [Rhodobacteraceae bacterium]|nr:TRAP transporter large permease subunit [Paracoccaceae bacterium]MBT6521007.1 TRAP transporter large permease subunit [Paracoccaceae bacterium]MBT7344116.1 TRAP transporter large permease subunit [Paracoccaceae bacterium]MDG0985749.1 TRAP transporter large permease subunit [Planktomarina sp.]
MDIGTISLVLLVGLLVLLAIGMPLGLASAVMAVAVLVMKFEPALIADPLSFGDGLLTRKFGTGPLNILAQKIYGLLTDYVLISIPLFIFMAALLERSGIAKGMYTSLNVWLSGVRGGIAIVTSVMAVIMAAMSGIIGGEVVLLGLIALPQMLRLGYNQNLAIGTICASGSLGTMIPPSIVLIIYGLITETSIKALFTGAFVPGFMLAMMFILYIIVRTQLNPEQAPLPEPKPGDPQGAEKWALFGAFLSIITAGFSFALFLRVVFFTLAGQNIYEEGVDAIAYGTPDYIPWFGGLTAISLALIFFVFGIERARTGWNMGKGLVAPIVVIGVVLGSIYGGISGITEAAGMGVVAVLIISVFRGEASFDLVWESLMRTLKSTGTIIWVTIGAAALAGAYTIAGGPQYVADLIVGLDMPTMGILLMMMLILLFMGAFMDWVGIVLLIIPVFLPIVQRLPIEEIGLIGQLEPRYLSVWFGVLFCMNMQVSFLSPPFGPAAFYLKSVAPAHISLTDIFKGFLPFICVQLLALAVMLIWPNIVTLLL